MSRLGIPAIPSAVQRVAIRCALWLLASIAALILCGASPDGTAHAVQPDGDKITYLPHVVAPGSRIIIAAAHIDSAVSYEPDEAILLWNIGGRTQDLAGWQLSTASRRATIPVTATLSLAPGHGLWCAAQEAAFHQSFGHSPGCVWESADSVDPVLLSGGLALTNRGGQIQLRDTQGRLVDALLYGDATRAIEGWSGAPAQAYTRGAIGAEGQVLHRKRQPVTAQPMDTDRATDWAGDLADTAWGRRVQYPGWELDTLAHAAHSQEAASVTVAVAPEGLYEPMHAALRSAQHAIDLSLYVVEHPQLAQDIADAAARGLRVRLLLEGSPVGGISDLQRWCVARIAAAGADVRYLAVTEAAPRGYQTRYRYAHAKYGIIDGVRSFVGTENLSWDSAPVAVEQPAGGRRGFFLFTDAPTVAQALSTIFNADWQPDRFADLQPYAPGHPLFGDPPPDYTPPAPREYPITNSPFVQPVTAGGPARFVVASAPENALRPDEGLLALLDRAGPGDEILVAQLYEHKYWGDSNSNPVADPNPRLARYVEAARRGASVRILLDSFFDEPEALRSNRATVDYVNLIAHSEGLDLQARLGNPTGGGLHAKLVLLRLGEERWSAVGSLNGGEVSHKLNREVMLLVDMPAVHARLAEAFQWDWNTTSSLSDLRESNRSFHEG